jgi:hypothetical protein
MDEVIWIETLARREVVARQRASGAVITVGRAYDNDIVLDDPHVAPHHRRLLRGEDGQWSAEDLGSLNGAFVNGERRDLALLDGDAIVQIGQTGIRLRSSAWAVPPERPLLRARSWWPWALGCMAALMGVMLLQVWLNQTSEARFIAWLALPLEVAIAVGAWAAIWSILSRIFTGSARYGLHLLIGSAGLLALLVHELLTRIGAFALSWPALATHDAFATWPIVGLMCYAHLRAFGRSRLVVKAVSVSLLAGAGLTIGLLLDADARSRTNQPATALLDALQPPALRLAQPQPPDAFFAAAAALKAPLDESRTRDLPAGEDEEE